MKLRFVAGLACWLGGWLGLLPGLGAAPIPPAQLDFFEQKIRPILVDECYKCHSHDSEKIKGGLLLDTRDDLLKGGDTGVAIIPFKPDQSLLISAVRYTNKDLQMPPGDKQLAPEQIRALEEWVRMGAPDPRTNAPEAGHSYVVDFASARKHWAYQPVKEPAVPTPPDANHWAQTPIDAFILAKLDEKGLSPSQKADKVTLLRRATFDLIGLPPSPQEVTDFLADNDTNAFAKVVDRLLASPHYGERWGRHWLDLTHYADTRGVEGGNRDERYPYSYTYRDYVIRAFNEDLPYDQFLRQQIAADKLATNTDRRDLAALGFLTLGNRFNNSPNDVIDDRIDTVCKSTMALTVTCARCHDHKFDPIPTKDYYALHGVFNSCEEPKEEPLIETPADQSSYEAFQREYKQREAALDKFLDETVRDLKAEMIGKSGLYMLASAEFHRASNDLSRPAFLQKRGLFPQLGAIWDNHLRMWENRGNPVFAPWFAFANLPPEDFANHASELAAKFHANADKKHPINAVVARVFATPPASLAQVAARYTTVFSEIDAEWLRLVAASGGNPPKGLSDPAQEQIRQLMYAPNSPMLADDNRINFFINRDPKRRREQGDLQKAITDLIITHPGSPARAPVLEDAAKPKDSYVFVKGNVGIKGPVVPRHFLSVLSDGTPKPFHEGSGRLELAEDIASRDNPLTARVMVNRIWLNHFGEGLVRTPDDFGSRGEPPSHPELLDYLARRFMEGGWSIKQMHRLIMLSSVYQQVSEENPRYSQIDPENRFLWRMNRRRLDFEALRDTILAIGGDLDLKVGGRPVRLDSEPFSMRRSIYGYIDRKSVPGMYQAFDFPSPDLTTGRRESTMVPQQALFMMNNDLVIQQARNVVRRADFKTTAGAEARVGMLYHLVYQRDPTELELKLALDFLQSDSGEDWQTTSKAAWDYGFGEYDPINHRTRAFYRLGTYNGHAWVPAAKNPDAKIKGMNLTAEGGTPGRGFAVIRRWTAPRDGFVSVEGMLVRTGAGGQGLTARVVSYRWGEVGNWNVASGQSETKIPRIKVTHGDTIDFIVEGSENPGGAAFKWAPRIQLEGDFPADVIKDWDAKRDFSGAPPPQHLTAWEKFAQVLLETNELTFIN